MAKSIPFPFDMLMRPVKYVEAPGVFVCGGYRFEDIQKVGRLRWVIYRGDATGEENRTGWNKVYEQTKGALTYIPSAGAYGAVGANPNATPPNPGKPTFIMVGQEFYPGTSSSDKPFFRISILVSHDGESWSEAFAEKNGWAYAAAWDHVNKRFLAQCITDIAQDAFTHSVFASTNGSSWSRIETRPGFEAGPEPQPSGLMTATGTPLVKDTVGNIVPNGSYFGLNGTFLGLSEGNADATIIAPKVLNPYYGSVEESAPVPAVEIIKRTVDPETGAVTTTRSNRPMPFPVASVTYSGGVYQATGSVDGPSWMIASSYDDGEHWTVDLTVDSHKGICVMAGPELTPE